MDKRKNRWRVYLGMFLFGLYFLILGALPWIIGLVYRYVLFGWLVQRRTGFNPFSWVPHVWTGALWHGLYKNVVQVSLVKETPEWPKIYPSDRVLLLANHPRSVECAPAYWMFAHHLWPGLGLLAQKRRVGAIMATKNSWSPIGGFLHVIGTAIMINRKNRSDALYRVEQDIGRVFVDGTTLLLHPDMGRPKPESMVADHAKFPEHSSWLVHTRQPRIGALHTILQALRQDDSSVRIIDVTWGFGLPGHTMDQWYNAIGKRFFVHAQEESLEDIPEDEEELKAWINNRYRRKNIQLEMWGKLNGSQTEHKFEFLDLLATD